jgi:hypothetical protein
MRLRHWHLEALTTRLDLIQVILSKKDSVWIYLILFFFYLERLPQQNRDRRERDQREYCTLHECSWKQDIIWLFAPPPLSPQPDKRRHIVFYLPFTPLTPCPPPPLPHSLNTEATGWFSRLASNSEVVNVTADIGQQ